MALNGADPSAYRSEINAVRAYRRSKEEEETKLANRIALLQAELKRSEKSIVECERHAKEAELRRKEAEARQAEIERARREEEEERRRVVEENRRRKEEQERRKAERVRRVAEKRAEEARKTKEEKERLREIMLEERREERLRVKMAKISVQRARPDIAGIQTGIEAGRREKAKKLKERRLDAEAEKTRAAECKVQSMEKKEQELIDQLNAMREKQQAALQKLERSLGDSAAARTKLPIKGRPPHTPRRSRQITPAGTPKSASSRKKGGGGGGGGGGSGSGRARARAGGPRR